MPQLPKKPDRPAILVSYINLDKFLKERKGTEYRSWVLDSGAYSVLTSGATIDLAEYTDRAGELLRDDPSLQEVFALDVIGDPEASAKNVEWMIAQGVPAIPTFHYGSAWHYLEGLSKQYNKLAIGGLVARSQNGHGTNLQWTHRLKFLENCFARIWPKWVHGFGCCDKRLMRRLPFASVDSTSWYYALARYGALQFGTVQGSGQKNRIVPSAKDDPKGFAASARVQVDWHLALEREIQGLFGPVLSKAGIDRFSLRLVVSGPEIKYLEVA